MSKVHLSLIYSKFSFAHYQDYSRHEGIILVLCVMFGILFLFHEACDQSSKTYSSTSHDSLWDMWYVAEKFW